MVVSLIAQHFRGKESKESHQVDIVRGKGMKPDDERITLTIISSQERVWSFCPTGLQELAKQRLQVSCPFQPLHSGCIY